MAFTGIAPSLPSHPSSSKTHYDVFINHRGRDVKRKLASVIHEHLTSLGVSVFLDQRELQPGAPIPVEIEEAMNSAHICIAIFSENYAESPWCLAELSFMVNAKTKIIPVFYHVEPSDVRRAIDRTGQYAGAFLKHEEQGRYKSEMLDEWKTALQTASYNDGLEFSETGDKGELLKRIKDCVFQELNKKKVPLYVAKHPVGLDAAVRRFEIFIKESAEDSQNVQLVGIVGIGGSGKTTLVKELFNQKCLLMAKSSIVFDVGKTPENYGLCNLQKKILEDITGHKNFRFDDISRGKVVMDSQLKSARMLIVLDGVDDVEQLECLLPDKKSFGHDSLIIVTARDKGILKNWGISSIFEMELLNSEHAKQLFCLHAFERAGPLPGFEDLVGSFLNVCSGLPLSLKVIGRMVCGREKDFCQSKLDRVSRILPEEIETVLTLSFDSLQEEEQQMFLDTACFFVGEKKSLAVEVWDGAGWSGLQGLHTLLDKCLVDLDQNERIRMHHHLSDLGKKIAKDTSPYRIWVAEKIDCNRGRRSKIPKEIRGIMAATTEFAGNYPHQEFPACSNPFDPPFEECMHCLEDLNGSRPRRFSLLLQLLVVAHRHFNENFAELSTDLVWLRLFDLKDERLPTWISLRKLRVLEICGALSLQELWTDDNRDPPSQLRELTVAANTGISFHTFPMEISRLKCLKKLVLIPRCGDEFSFKRLPEDFCELVGLQYLELRFCRRLSSLPSRFGELKNLQHLDLCHCDSLVKLPSSFKDLTELKFLDLSDCMELEVASDILKMMKRLEKLLFSRCKKLQQLPCDFTVQKSLKELHLADTILREVPSSVDQLSKLETLNIGTALLTSLPASLYRLHSLTHLTIRRCCSLHSLPDCIDSSIESTKGLARLQHLCIESTEVSCLSPLLLCKLNNLEILEISHCPISNLCLTSCSLNNLKVINLTKASVTCISIPEECCPSLETLKLRDNDYLEEIKELPPSVKLIELVNCGELQKIRCLPAPTKLNLKVSNCPRFRHSTEP